MKSAYPMSSNSSAALPTPNKVKSPQLTLVAPAVPASPTPIRQNAWKVAPNLFTSFRYAWAGVRYAFVTQRNFRIHTIVGFTIVSLGLALQLTATALAILTLTSSLVMILELLNTALESVVDLTVGQSYHELAKIAKDCAAGAVLVSAIAAVIVGVCLVLPSFLTLIV